MIDFLLFVAPSGDVLTFAVIGKLEGELIVLEVELPAVFTADGTGGGAIGS